MPGVAYQVVTPGTGRSRQIPQISEISVSCPAGLPGGRSWRGVGKQLAYLIQEMCKVAEDSVADTLARGTRCRIQWCDRGTCAYKNHGAAGDNAEDQPWV